MHWKHVLIWGAFISLLMTNHVQAQSSDYFTGFYGGLEGGAVSYNTQITFDGVDDPAGRGGAGYGAYFGYNHVHTKLLVGAELLFNLATIPDPYTFDRAAAGFAELDLRRGAIFAFDIRAGYLIAKKLLLYGSAGFAANKQSVRIDDIPLDQFAGGAATKKFGALHFDAGLEVAILRKLGIRFSFRTLGGHDLNITDFGTIPTEASLTRFDVEPSQQQFFVGLTFRF